MVKVHYIVSTTNLGENISEIGDHGENISAFKNNMLLLFKCCYKKGVVTFQLGHLSIGLALGGYPKKNKKIKNHIFT